MISRNQVKCTRRLVGLLVVLTLMSIFVVDVVQAGDTDGITGYSIRLKNKDFDGSDGSSGQNVVVGPNTAAKDSPVILEVEQGTWVVRSRATFIANWRWFLRLIAR